MDIQDGKMKELWEKMRKAEKWADEHEYQKLLDKIQSLKNEKESYFKNREGSHPRVRKIEQELAELERKMKMFKDTMDQLALIGITQDADPSQEIRNDYIQEIYKLEKEMARLYRMGQGAQAAKIDQQLKNLRKELRELNTKDDDATEHGSIETYGKEKETETMPLEKDPVQAQDGVGGLFGYEQNVGRKKLKGMLEELKRKKQTLERAISSQEHYYTNPKTKQDEQELAGIEMQIQTVQHMLSKATHDEEPTQDKSNEELFGKETMTTQEAREYWNKHHNDDPILKDYPNFEAWYRESKRNGYIEDEEPTNAVKDSYEMLKLCGIIS